MSANRTDRSPLASTHVIWMDETPPSDWPMQLVETCSALMPSLLATRSGTSPLLARKATCSRLTVVDAAPPELGAEELSARRVWTAW